MKKKISLLFLGSILSGMMLGLTGCNTNNKNDINPPSPTNNRMDNDLNNNGINDRYENNLKTRDVRDNNVIDRNYYPESEDKNTQTDKDTGKDNNTPREEIIEDDIDRHDRDNKDE
ncbi:hypothetical protein [Neobacillus cucumis]|uniref:hypothetical protein n=1 Tax=Neobacillus cucumis TaxID=1740721 RepID=UPI002E1F390C|nr:hypothetical protein [Neobacillus cucumis]